MRSRPRNEPGALLSIFRRDDRRGQAADHLVVGLGNPGSEYARSRHNLGADCVRLLAERHGAALKRSKERALTADIRIAERLVALAFPQTFMNLSGESVSLLVRRYGITKPSQIIVVYDELDFPVGTLRVKAGGGLAGHNGLKSIQQHLHDDGFLRVRIGIGKPPGRREGTDHVLRKPGAAEAEQLAVSVQLAADAIECIVGEGVDRAMNRFNTA